MAKPWKVDAFVVLQSFEVHQMARSKPGLLEYRARLRCMDGLLTSKGKKDAQGILRSILGHYLNTIFMISVSRRLAGFQKMGKVALTETWMLHYFVRSRLMTLSKGSDICDGLRDIKFNGTVSFSFFFHSFGN